MRNLLFIYLSFLFAWVIPIAFCQSSSDAMYEHILHYHSDLVVQKNGTIAITERVKVYANQDEIRRGIYRDLPLSYDYKGGTTRVGFELLAIEHNGNPAPYHTEKMSNGIRIYVGEENTIIPVGVHEYTFTYTITRGLGYFDEYDEIYWNINGNGWKFTIDSISANVYYPEGASLVQFDAYTGAFGSMEKAFVADTLRNGIRFSATRPLYSGENLTVAVAWDKNHIVYPTDWENFLYWVQSYFLWIISTLGVLLGLFINFRLWWKHGRDPKPGTIIPRFYPPENLSPAECIYLKKGGKRSNTMFGSMLVALAVKGKLTISVEEGSGLFSKKSYTINKLAEVEQEGKKPLTPVESYFFETLLGNKTTESIQKGKYNPRIAKTHDKLIEKIDGKQKEVYFKRNTYLKGIQFITPLIVAAIGFVGFYFFGGAVLVLILGLLTMILMNVIFARLYEQPTAMGRKIMDEIAGFEMYMKYTDKERIRLMNPPTMNFSHYEENLPYAIALGVAEEWAGKFDPVELKEGYQHHMPYIAGFAVNDFNDFGKELNSTISSASTPPSSSGSGSGGGGFSGGGGGGGGGGGW